MEIEIVSDGKGLKFKFYNMVTHSSNDFLKEGGLKDATLKESDQSGFSTFKVFSKASR